MLHNTSLSETHVPGFTEVGAPFFNCGHCSFVGIGIRSALETLFGSLPFLKGDGAMVDKDIYAPSAHAFRDGFGKRAALAEEQALLTRPHRRGSGGQVMCSRTTASGGWAIRCATTGNMEASVLPPAVGARTTALLPSGIAAPASSWTGRRDVQPRRETMASWRRGGNLAKVETKGCLRS